MELIAPGVKHFTDSKFCLATDLGQSNDPTAAAVIEHAHHSHVTVKGGIIKKWDEYLVRHLERLPLGTDYVQQVEYIRQLYMRPPLNGTCDLIIDDTGVGKAVGDIFLAAGLKPLRVTITAGDKQTAVGTSRWHVAKSLLVSMLDAKLHTQELKIAPALADAAILREELRDFRRNVSAAGRFTYEARVGKHDDLILACALGIWNFAGRKKLPSAVIGKYTIR